ncbi:hypothetical protein LTR36_001286 [Oleoguttula mirabilis]|uniref:Uncharacterized protein n=1 Tax=Oleoguttula mirabilis TaxID=1507867 RepID=A0AAV9JPF2_9PEZI|nr:hypothetical protein LTR36_001286 [Oleoguttula mirabilis]
MPFPRDDSLYTMPGAPVQQRRHYFQSLPGSQPWPNPWIAWSPRPMIDRSLLPDELTGPSDPRNLQQTHAALGLLPPPDDSGDPPGWREMRHSRAGANEINRSLLPNELTGPPDPRELPQIRTAQTIPAGKSFKLGDQVLPPMNGPKGYGVYIESEESPDIGDFYPCEQQQTVAAVRRKQAVSHVSRLEKHVASPDEKHVASPDENPPAADEEEGFVPFDLPSPGKPVDRVDPKWKAMLSELAKLDNDNLGSVKNKEELFRHRILPMMKYIRSLPGEVAAGYHEKLVQQVRDLGYGDLRGYAAEGRGRFEEVGSRKSIVAWEYLAVG